MNVLRQRLTCWLPVVGTALGVLIVGLAILSPLNNATISAQESKAKTTPSKSAKPATKEAAAEATPETVKLPPVFSTGHASSIDEVVKFINEKIRAGWQDNNIPPSEVADDSEWIRRVHLDIVGHTPDLETVEKFLADKDKSKRAKLIDKLLDDPAYARNLTTIWTNNLIGRVTPRDISRPALQKFLRESFGKNRGWNEIVSDLVSAQGHHIENGATNFLLSHLNDGAVPATAITAKLFLGMQVQCTQCHNHPFNDWKQSQFWEFNSFFQQSRRVNYRKYNPQTGRQDFDYMELVPANFEGPVYYERRSGLMEVAYPKFNGTEVNPGGSTNRRAELAKIMTTGEKPLIADAMVNRMWGHFFGYGFSRPVDDMGPHNPPSHPAVLEKMAAEFVKANFDLKQLIRWICNSEAYNLTSKYNPKNLNDNPSAGETPLFSHMYVKSMTGEQLYDSLIIATNAHKAGNSWEDAERDRQRWMQQFVTAFGTDENDETTSFDGTIPQALMMMNGELIQRALNGKKGSVLSDVLSDKGSAADKVKTLYLATLSRTPSAKEIAAANRILKSAKSPLEAYQDLYWALLNSNEFIFVH